jgi:exo-beta-1,3-glucanase (GH17 family)
MAMKKTINLTLVVLISLLLFSCSSQKQKASEVTAEDILGNPNFPAFSFGGYRHNTREIVPTVDELKDDMKILSAMGVKLLRTYNTNQFDQARNLLEAIKQLKEENPSFEMYAMLGTWIECEGAWTHSRNHTAGNVENNTAEIHTAVEMAKTYPDIVKIIAVGNEAMVHWAANYYVTPKVILKWVDYLQNLKITGGIPKDIWITSSDNFASWGGGDISYHTEELTALIKAVDFVSLHTYPFHDTHYNPSFWAVPSNEKHLSDIEKINAAMLRARDYAIMQYQNTVDYISGLGIEKPIHIGETGWATIASSSYGATGSHATDEYKEKLYYDYMREWTNNAGMSCFYFEAFDEQWKDQGNALGSENHFGLINLKGQAKYALWDLVDKGVFDGLTRNGVPISKTYNGDKKALMNDVKAPPLMSEIGLLEIVTVNQNRKVGQKVTEQTYVIVNDSLIPSKTNNISYPSAKLKLNSWEGTCGIELSSNSTIEVLTGAGNWWGCALEIQTGGIGENLSDFANGCLNFDMKGTTKSAFKVGFQTGTFSGGNLVENYVTFGPTKAYTITENWQSYSLPISELNKGANLEDVTGLLYIMGETGFDGKQIYFKNIYYSKEL